MIYTPKFIPFCQSIDNLLEELKAKQKLRQLGQEIVSETTDKSKAMMTGVDLTTVLVVSSLSVKTTEEDLLTEFGRCCSPLWFFFQK